MSEAVPAARRYRVAQWATGNVGTQSLRAILQHPRLELVGLRVYAKDKVGRDAGELCGLPPTGIVATDDIERILAAKPDCVAYMPNHSEIDVMCRLLEAGLNIATPRYEFNSRDRLDPEWRARIEAACERGRSTLYATGSTPGWSTEIMPMALTLMMRRLDAITLTEYADMSSRNSPEMLFKILPFGADPAKVADRPHATAHSSPPSLSATAAAFGLPADEVICSHEYATTRSRVTIPAGTLEAGTIGAMRMVIDARHQGHTVIRRRTTWYVTKDVEPDWDLRDTGWRYQVEGDVPLDVSISIPVAAADYPRVSPGFTAHPVVNAIPSVCEAAPGIRHTAEMGPIIPYFGR